jgi:hypothetical protein
VSNNPPPPYEVLTEDGKRSAEVWYRWFELIGINIPQFGSFTPTLTTTGADFASVTYDNVRDGRYCRIGNIVLFWVTMKTDAVDTTGATGTVAIGNMPFTSALTAAQFFAVTVGYAAGWAGEHPMNALMPGAGTQVRLYYRATSDAANTASAISDVGTGANANEIYLSGHYLTTT